MHRIESYWLHDSDTRKMVSRQRHKILCQEMVSETGSLENCSEDENRDVYLASVAVEAIFVVFPLQLTVSR